MADQPSPLGQFSIGDFLNHMFAMPISVTGGSDPVPAPQQKAGGGDSPAAPKVQSQDAPKDDTGKPTDSTPGIGDAVENLLKSAGGSVTKEAGSIGSMIQNFVTALL